MTAPQLLSVRDGDVLLLVGTAKGAFLFRLRRLTGGEIARRVSVSPATVARILARHGLARLKALDPKEPIRRYQREHPGELLLRHQENSAGSKGSVIASPETEPTALEESVGSSSTLPSMTLPASLTRRS